MQEWGLLKKIYLYHTFFEFYNFSDRNFADDSGILQNFWSECQRYCCLPTLFPFAELHLCYFSGWNLFTAQRWDLTVFSLKDSLITIASFVIELDEKWGNPNSGFTNHYSLFYNWTGWKMGKSQLCAVEQTAPEFFKNDSQNSKPSRLCLICCSYKFQSIFIGVKTSFAY